MLKVVGASWLKTRISSYIILGAGLLSIAALFLAEMEKPEYNGIYCATVYWSQRYGFRVEFWGQQSNLLEIPKGVARTCYKDSTLKTGWSQIEIETQPDYPDWVQAYSAGMLEGALTWSSIYNHWSNTVDAYCETDERSQLFCVWLRDIIASNFNRVRETIEQRGKQDHYWYQIRLFYHQLEGLANGWNTGVERSRAELKLSLEDFLLLNAAPDIRDLRIYYENIVNPSADVEYVSEPAKASMLLKITEQNGLFDQVFIGHSSDGSYSSMLRVMKKYIFHYHFSNNHKTSGQVSGVEIAFTSYPGSLASSDDFYIIGGAKSNLTVAGIRIDNNNVNLWHSVNLDGAVLLGARVMAANRLSHSGRTWAKVMSRNPSFGTKQWMILDTKRLHRSIDINNTIINSTAIVPLPVQPLLAEKADPLLLQSLDETKENETSATEQTEEDQTYMSLQPIDLSENLEDVPLLRPHDDNSLVDDENETNAAQDSYEHDSGMSESSEEKPHSPDVEITQDQKHENADDIVVELPRVMDDPTGIIWIVDQLPGRLHAEDMTQEIVYGSGYWTGEGKPFFEEMLQASHIHGDEDEVTHLDVLCRTNITDIGSVAKVLKLNAYRGDLMGEHASAFGNIDIKLFSETKFGKMEFRALAGPLYFKANLQKTVIDEPEMFNDNQLNEIEIFSERRAIRDDIRAHALLNAKGPFRWSETKLQNVEHNGHPDVWNFDHISPTWAWKTEHF